MTSRAELCQRLPWYANIPPSLACGEGWFGLIENLHERLAMIDPGYQVTQVKEKFGQLRYYVMMSAQLDDQGRQTVYDALAAAESDSATVCEICGRPGRLNDGSWLRTRCQAHWR